MLSLYEKRTSWTTSWTKRIRPTLLFTVTSRFVFLIIICVFVPFPTFAFGVQQEPNSQQESHLTEIPLLIEQLGSNEHAIRTESYEKLLSIGGPAIPLLRKAVAHQGPTSPDSEVRLRSTRLLILIEREAYEKKIRDFLDGTRETIDLTGWPEFSAEVGSEKVARQLFVAMHEAQPELMNSIEDGREEAEEQHQNVVRRRMHNSNFSNANHVLGTIASVVFIASLEMPSKTNGTSSRIAISDYNLTRIRSYIVKPQMNTFIEGTSHKQQIDRLISNWLAGLSDSDGKSLMMKLEIIKAMKLRDELPLVLRTINNREINKASRIYSLRITEALGNKSLISELENAFDDQEVLGNYLLRKTKSKDTQSPQVEPIEVRFCDLALAVAIQLKELSPADFGFHSSAFTNGNFVSNRAGFTSNENRKAAFELWHSIKE